MMNKVKFVNDNTLAAEGIGDVLITRKDTKQSIISNVLYILDMKSNLLSIGKLIKKNYKILIEDKMMRVLDLGGKLILKEPMSHNKTFKIKLDVMEHKCLTNGASRDERLWHYRLGHLNFRDINNLKRKNMISREIHIPNKVCNDVRKPRNTRRALTRMHEENNKLLLNKDVNGARNVQRILPHSPLRSPMFSPSPSSIPAAGEYFPHLQISPRCMRDPHRSNL